MSSLARFYVEPEKLRDLWHFVRPGLLKVKEASKEPWIPEDIYTDCYTGRSMLWVLTDGKDCVGFGIMQPLNNVLHVWAAWGKFLMDDGFYHIREIAKLGGASRITFESNRPGWAKIAHRFGFKPVKWAAEV